METKIKESIEQELNNENIKLLSVKLGVEDNVKTLFITIDSDNKVDIELCEKAMKIISPIIDSLDLNLEEYVLDVCSKGDCDEF